MSPRPASIQIPATRPTVLALCLTLCACQTVPPPPAPLHAPTAWGTPAPATLGTWRLAQPGDAHPKGRWWQSFADPVLDDLIGQALLESPSLEAVAAKVRQARAQLAIVVGAEAPRVIGGFRPSRTRSSANRPAATANDQALSSTQNDFTLGLALDYELDLFGRKSLERASVQNYVEQARADLGNAQLILSADIAATYFGLRSLDAEIATLDQGLLSQTRAVELLQARFEGGAASRLDLAQQQALLDATRTQRTLLTKQRAVLHHALATLVGTPASTYSLPAERQPARVPDIPVALPSETLERRPDVAAAQRAVAAANAQVGLARVAAYPSLSLSASGGLESKHLAQLFDAPSLVWALGASLAQTLADGGRTEARVAQALAARDQTLADYRLIVLRAIQDVEDGLATLDTLAQAAADAETAVSSAQRVLALAQDRYAGGLTTYLEVVTAQQNALTEQRLARQIQGQRLQAAAYLIKALGGDWRTDDAQTALLAP